MNCGDKVNSLVGFANTLRQREPVGVSLAELQRGIAVPLRHGSSQRAPNQALPFASGVFYLD
jgi:hypothetical protein